MSFLPDLDLSKLPKHVAIVMDGNGRWAMQRGLPRTEGHRAGEKALFRVVDSAIDIGLEWLTVYAFSTENWQRPPSEVRYLMGFNRTVLRRRRNELHRRGARLRFIGREESPIPPSVLREMETARDLTRANTGLTLTIALNYGGRQEIGDAARRLLAEVVAGRAGLDQVTPEGIARHLHDPEMPDPDLIVRTGGEMRISNFLLWQAAYAELWFTPIFWPDFTPEHLFEALRDYQKRDRRFGAIQQPL